MMVVVKFVDKFGLHTKDAQIFYSIDEAISYLIKKNGGLHKLPTGEVIS